MSQPPQLAEVRRHLDDAGRLADEVRAMLRADRIKRGGGQTELSERSAATSHGAAQPPVSSTAHDSDTAGREDVQDLRAQNSALQESLAHAEARATSAETRADAAEHKLKALHEKGVASTAGVAGAMPAVAQEEQQALTHIPSCRIMLNAATTEVRLALLG